MTDIPLTLMITKAQLDRIAETAPDRSIVRLKSGGYEISNPEAVKALLPGPVIETQEDEQ